ncbi:MAG TPA: TetR/AcrR family transcriptional regulator [Gemmatimonadales bacterium]|nr:TetR/AcrR family transcriptional regulator [Gemmatimonadales bacterium]
MKQHQEARERLIEAARQAFAKDGFEGASVRDITARARANLGAITYHFGSKEALYHAVIERFAEPLADRLAAISRESGAPLERLAAAARAFMEHMWSHPEMPCLMVRELASDRPLPPPVAKVIRRNVESFTRIITEGQANGTIRPGEPHLFAMSIAGQPLFLALAGRAIREAIGVDPGDPAMRHLITEHVIANLRASFATPAAGAAAGGALPNPSQDRTP